jgi:hypothetical protein
MGDIDFNFTVEQKEQFNIILKETQKEYPHSLNDEISSYRIKVLIAHNVIFGDNKEMGKEETKQEEFIEVS